MSKYNDLLKEMKLLEKGNELKALVTYELVNSFWAKFIFIEFIHNWVAKYYVNKTKRKINKFTKFLDNYKKYETKNPT